MARRPTLLIDFDDTLSQYLGWDEPMGPPLENARRACLILENDFRLCCFTTRALRDRPLVEAWLRNNGFPDMRVTCYKEAGFIIDNNALRFEGWTPEFLNLIREKCKMPIGSTGDC